MKKYLDILYMLLNNNNNTSIKPTRTGIDTISYSGVQFEHFMANGFPLLTTKFVSLKNVAIELEFFIKGLSDKKWLQERGCHIWDEWANPKKVDANLKHIKMIPNDRDKWYPTSVDNIDVTEDELRKVIQKSESDLGRIYGVQWRNWTTSDSYDCAYLDQLKDVIKRAKKDPLDRRLLVSAWRPDELNQMALPPCHYAWQILSDGINLDLIWIQRSVDVGLGLPYNIASYGLLLLLLAKELNLTPRRLVGQLGDTHIYENHIDKLKEQIYRTPYELPIVTIPDENWKSIFDWTYENIKLEHYKHHSSIKLEIAI